MRQSIASHSIFAAVLGAAFYFVGGLLLASDVPADGSPVLRAEVDLMVADGGADDLLEILAEPRVGLYPGLRATADLMDLLQGSCEGRVVESAALRSRLEWVDQRVADDLLGILAEPRTGLPDDSVVLRAVVDLSWLLRRCSDRDPDVDAEDAEVKELTMLLLDLARVARLDSRPPEGEG